MEERRSGELKKREQVDPSVLQEVSIFDNISESTIRDILSSAESLQFQPEEIIFMEGEPASYIYVLRSGWVKSTRMTPDGREQAMMFLKPTQIFGDVAVFLGTEYPATVTALEEVEVWRIPGEKYTQFICTHPDLSMAVIKKLSRRVLHYMSLVEDLSLRTVDARVANYLMTDATVKAGQLIVPRSSWQTYDQMAVRLGTVRDVLSRTLSAFESEGLIRVTRPAIELLDPERLAKKAKR
ncbi:MAG TPA: Crp/Fnr family transcriptional regulator [Bellilinea sp.]|nr:Crp/Fnr family transcriptional regulator [Bellilinea sp.]